MTGDWFVVDAGVDDRRRETRALQAGWWPDVAGEVEASRLLYSGLDAAQRATLVMLRDAGVL